MKAKDSRSSSRLGPLRINPQNSRYFADPSGKTVYLTGSHTWDNFQDIDFTTNRIRRASGPPFDFDGYLTWLVAHDHNFIRLWVWEHATFYHDEDSAPRFYPTPYCRTGPGEAVDGEPRFDLDYFDQGYFDRLRARVSGACEHGIYVAIMLFQGFSINDVGTPEITKPWYGHPFHLDNNINGVNGDLKGDGSGLGVHTLGNRHITTYQEAYVRHVIDTTNDLDNVLYEIANESPKASRDWQYHMIEYIKRYEASKESQHPVGMTAHMDLGTEPDRGSFEELINSPADWISPSQGDGAGDWMNDPPLVEGRKVIITDTDHLWGMGGDRQWVWKSFCRGLNPIYMDGRKNRFEHGGLSWDAEDARKAMGQTRRYALRIDTARALPSRDIASTGFCLANPGVEYIVYNPQNDRPGFVVELPEGEYACEWFDPENSIKVTAKTLKATGGKQKFTSPFKSDAVLLLQRAEP